MTESIDHEDQRPNDPKTPWVAPVVQTLIAGQAEVGTHANGDGAYTSS